VTYLDTGCFVKLYYPEPIARKSVRTYAGIAPFDPAPALHRQVSRRQAVNQNEQDQRNVKHPVERQGGLFVQQLAEAVAAIHDVTGQQKQEDQRQQRPAAPADNLEQDKIELIMSQPFVTS